MPVNLGFLGFGIMGERLLRAALDHKNIEVTGIYDPSPAAARRLAAVSPSLTRFDSAAAVIAASDCLHIASPPASHLDYLARCADAGKAALCEKPLATDVDAAAAAVAKLGERGMRAAVNFPMASSPAVEKIMAWLEEGVVGTPQRVDVELAFAAWPRGWQVDAASWLDRPAEGGFTREVGSHFLFLTRRLFGPLTLSAATCDRPDPARSERAITATLSAGGLPVTLTGSVGTTDKDDHNIWMLTGETGRVRLRDWSFAERETTDGWRAPHDAVPNERMRPMVLARQLDKIAAMTAHEPTNLATLAEALDVQRLVEAILRSK